MNKAWRLVVVVASAALLGGCIAQRTVSSLKEVPNAESRLAGMKFRVISVEPDAGGKAGTELQASLQSAYPALFSDDARAIPLAVRKSSTYHSQMVGAFLTGLTLGVVPIPVSYGDSFEVGVTPWGAQGAVAPESRMKYSIDAHEWATILTPLGLIPNPGRSDIPRRSAILMDEPGLTAYEQKRTAFRQDQYRRAVVSALASSDLSRLRAYWGERQAIPVLNVDIDGRRYEGVLVPAFSRDIRQAGGADQYTLVLSNSRTEGGQVITTKHTLPVARRDAAGGWQVSRVYLPFSARPMVATALLEGGVPARALVLPVEAPPLADFVSLADISGPDAATWVRRSNGILLQIKNTSLTGELAGKSLPELQELLTQLESTLLDLNERTTRANDRAQQAIEKGESPDYLRELATVYRQRSEILKAILGIVRQEATVRGAP